jgi:hypothetical protein
MSDQSLCYIGVHILLPSSPDGADVYILLFFYVGKPVRKVDLLNGSE